MATETYRRFEDAIKKLILAVVTFSISAAYAHPGIGIVVDSRGNVYYTDLKQVWRLAPDGKVEVAVPGVHTHELCLDASDNLYGEHLWYEGDRTGKWGHYVWKRTANGAVEKVIPATSGFLNNYSFVRDKPGNMYWAARTGDSTRILRRSDAGVQTIAESRFRDVRWMAASSEGAVYLVDYQDLVRVLPGGKPEVVARGVAKNSRWMLLPNNHAVMGLSPDAKGNVYLAVMADGEVKKVTPAGMITTVLRSPALWAPVGVFAGGKDVLWVLESSRTLGVRARKVAVK